MGDVVKALAGAPTLNLLLLLGVVLVVMGGAGRFPKIGRLDSGGRLFCGSFGGVLLAAALVVFMRMSAVRQQPPEDRSPAPGPTPRPAVVPTASPAPPAAPPPGAASPATKGGRVIDRHLNEIARVAPRPTRDIVAAPGAMAMEAAAAPVTRELTSPATYADWGCDEPKTVTVSLQLPANAHFLAAEVAITDLSNAAWFRRGEPAFDSSTRTVTGQATFQGLQRVFFNCPGGGHARVALTAKFSGPPG